MDWKNTKQTTTLERVRSATGPHALQLLEFAGLISEIRSKTQKFKVFDNAGGMGTATTELFEAIPPGTAAEVEVLCGDVSADAVSKASALFKEKGWNATAKIVDGTVRFPHRDFANVKNMDLPDDEFTHVVTAMGIMNMLDPVAGLKEALRVVKPGGVHVFSTVAVAGWIADFRDALASKLAYRGAPQFPGNGDFQMRNSMGERWHDGEWAAAKALDVGYVDVKFSTFETTVHFDTVEQYFHSMIGFLTNMLNVVWEKDEVERFGADVPDLFLNFLIEKYGSGSPYEYPLVTAMISGKKQKTNGSF